MKIDGLNILMKEFTGTEDELIFAIEILNTHKLEFEEFKLNGLRLPAVKRLKDLTGLGLKDSKDICDFYWTGKLSLSNIKEDRKEKLERLAKLPLVNELSIKILNLKEDELHSILLKLSIDELLTIDEYLPKLEY